MLINTNAPIPLPFSLKVMRSALFPLHPPPSPHSIICRTGPKEFVTMTSGRYSCKASKMNDIILIIVLLKRDERIL